MRRLRLRLTITKVALIGIVLILLLSFIMGAVMSGLRNSEVVRNTYRSNHKAFTVGASACNEGGGTGDNVAVAGMVTDDFMMDSVVTSGGILSEALMTSAKAMATVELTTGRVLYEKNAYQRLPMASTTKILTAITVLEHVSCTSEIVKVDDRAIGIEGTSIYLQKGEELTVKELLYGMMLRSGNDASNALALHVSKSIDDFAFLMNFTARKAGAKDSNFKNPHGLDEKDHYTTAYDLAQISAYAMRNHEFAEIVATKDVKISGKDYPRSIQNKNRLLRSNEDVIGIKTGFTSKAGRCFVGAMDEGGMTVINVVLNCGPMFPESEQMMERAGDEFFMHKILDKEKVIRHGKFAGMVAEDFAFPLRKGEIDKVRIEMDKENVFVFFGEKLIGTVEYETRSFEAVV